MAKNCNIITIEILSDYYIDDKKNDFQKWRQDNKTTTTTKIIGLKGCAT